MKQPTDMQLTETDRHGNDSQFLLCGWWAHGTFLIDTPKREVNPNHAGYREHIETSETFCCLFAITYSLTSALRPNSALER